MKLLFTNLFLTSYWIIYPFNVQGIHNVKKASYQYDVEKWLESINFDLSQFNTLAAQITWKLSTNPDEKTVKQAEKLGNARNRWKNKVCQSNIVREWLTEEQKRKMFLLCRGPRYENIAYQNYLKLLGDMEEVYNSEVCLKGKPIYSPMENSINFPTEGVCLHGEPDLERLMKRTDLSASQLRWIWQNWHNPVGSEIRSLYGNFVQVQNEAARNNGYNDIGEVWREELEIKDLENFVDNLYSEIEPLYLMLHGVVRHLLYEKYGSLEVNKTGPIPVHLLGNMWGQNWSPLIELFDITNSKIDLNNKLTRKNLTVKDMAYKAEDFYTSLGFPKMTEKFWKFSIFKQGPNATLCHGSAANMFNKDDFRILMCGGITMEDFYVIHHEMGHIEYYMAYKDQPPIFQDGTNTAFHESIGDAIMHGVLTPQHLYRLNLLTDTELLNSNTELLLLLQQAMAKIPEIPFSLIIDKYRWAIFRDGIKTEEWNKIYWDLNRIYRGIVPPGDRSEKYLDAGAKFHIPDDTPYIRYFLAGFVQMQIFQSLCEISMYGESFKNNKEYLPLHRCDIYGSKNAGKKLGAVMEKGASIHWSEALEIISGTRQISTKPFLDYYQPIIKWLETYIKKNNIFIGW